MHKVHNLHSGGGEKIDATDYLKKPYVKSGSRTKKDGEKCIAVSWPPAIQRLTKRVLKARS